MSNRKLAILGVLAAVTAIWAVVQSHISNRPQKINSNEPTYLIQGLNPNEIGSIVAGTGNNIVTIKRTDSGFIVAEKDNYPASTERINRLITSCLDIQTTELYTADKTNFKDLGVTEENAKAMAKFYKPDSTLMTGVIIGKNKEQGQGTFVRPVLSDNVYITLSAPWINDQPLDYLDHTLFSIDRANIRSVTVTGPNEVYVLNATDSNGVTLETIPEGKELKTSDAESVFTVLSYLAFEDVNREKPDDKSLNFDRKFTCKLKDSSVYDLSIAQKDGKTYIKCYADFTDNTPVTKKQEIESQDELKKKEAKLLALEKVEKFKAQHSSWLYEIPGYKADVLTKKLADLLQDKPKPEKSQTPGEPNSSAS